jgi:hypothetical protein
MEALWQCCAHEYLRTGLAQEGKFRTCKAYPVMAPDSADLSTSPVKHHNLQIFMAFLQLRRDEPASRPDHGYPLL